MFDDGRPANDAICTSNPLRLPTRCSSGPLIQFTTDPSYLPGPKAGPVLPDVGQEQVVTLQPAEWMQ